MIPIFCRYGWVTAERDVRRMPATDRGPLPLTSHGELVARSVSTMQRVPGTSQAILLRQRQEALLQTRLRQVSSYSTSYLSF